MFQRLLLRFLPKERAEWVREETKGWQIRCLTCGATRSLWEAGGVRAGAASRGKRTLIRCTRCGKLRWAAVERIADRDLKRV